MDEHEHLPDVLVEALLDAFDYDVPDACEHAAASQGRLFAKLYEMGDEYGIEHEELARVAGLAWAQWGPPLLPHDAWQELFDLAGYRVDDEPAARPIKPLRLWRGGLPEHRNNWSWTDDPDLPYHFAGPTGVVEGIGMIWTAMVEPWRLKAAVPEWRFTEYIVDTDGLNVQLYGLWCRCPVDLSGDPQRILDQHELVDCRRHLDGPSRPFSRPRPGGRWGSELPSGREG